MISIEKNCENYMLELCRQNPDPSHDILHVKRVVQMAKRIAADEGAELAVVTPAAYLHDCVYISKSDSRRSEASRLSADKALELLAGWNYPEIYFAGIHHAVLAHSFSASVPAETIEAKIVQDADRLDAIGAIGIARCFAFSGLAKRPLYSDEEPFSLTRKLNDQTNTLDHFYIKLLNLHSKLHTNFAKVEGAKRLKILEDYLMALKSELVG